MAKADSLQGSLDLLVLKVLSRRPRLHGYAIMSAIKELSGDVLRADEGSLYPALHRMEEDGWIRAEWVTNGTGRRARIYELTAAGKKQLANEGSRWHAVTSAVNRVLSTAVNVAVVAHRKCVSWEPVEPGHRRRAAGAHRGSNYGGPGPRRSPPCVRFRVIPSREEPGYSAHPLAGIVVCRCSFRMAATPEEKGDVGCRHPFARSRHWALRRGIPRHGRYAVAAVTGCRAGAALCSVQGSHRPGRQGHDI